MPQKIASHFNASGEADSYSNKDILIYLNLPIYLFILILFELFVYLTPRIPENLINLPNKDYWLSEGRKNETYSILRIYIRWMGIITLLLLMFVYNENYITNINNEHEIGIAFWIYLGAYLLITVFIVLKMNYRFQRFPNEEKPYTEKLFFHQDI